MSKREQRVIHAFLNCIFAGEFTADYAIILLEDAARYGWVSETAKAYFYGQIGQEETEE